MFRDAFDHLDALNDDIDDLMLDHNLEPQDDFEGLSPFQMYHILYDTFGKDSILSLKQMDVEEYFQIPIFNNIHHLLSIIENAGELKLTNAGYLPVKEVRTIYDKSLVKDEFEKYRSSLKNLKENDSGVVSLTRSIAEIAGLIKKRYNKLSLTKNGEKLIKNHHKLHEKIMSAYVNRLNWGYFDGYDADGLAQMGFGYSIFLIYKYGAEKRLTDFYAEKYFRAYPMMMMDEAQAIYRTAEEYSLSCYSIRTFDRFLYFFGAVEIETGTGWQDHILINKTDLFDKLFEVKL